MNGEERLSGRPESPALIRQKHIIRDQKVKELKRLAKELGYTVTKKRPPPVTLS